MFRSMDDYHTSRRGRGVHLLSRLSNIIRRERPTLSEYDVYDYLCTYISIEARGQLTALHMELLTDDGRGQLHIECLVTDGEALGVAGYDGAHHMLPSLDETMLVERSLEALLAEKLADEVAYGFGISTLHVFSQESGVRS